MVTTAPVPGDGAMVSAATNKILALMDAADRLGIWVAKAYGGKYFKSLEHGKVVALKCLTEGMTPDQFFQSYHILGTGQIVLTANAMLGKFKGLGGKYTINRNDDQACEITFEWQGVKVKQSFTIEQAKAKGLVKKDSAWETWGEDQLMWTVVRKYLRRYVPEHFAGNWNPDGTQEEAIIEYSGTPATVEAAAPDRTTPTLPAQSSGGGGGLNAFGELLDPPETAPPEDETVVEIDETPPAGQPDPQDDEPPSVVKQLLDAKIPLGTAIAFLRDVPHWLKPEEIEGVPASVVFARLKPNHNEQILSRFDEFCGKVRLYEKRVAGDSQAKGGDKAGTVQPPAGDKPADPLKPVAAGSVTAPAAKRKWCFRFMTS